MSTPGNQFSLSAWHKVQAAMLYHYASLDYLKGLHQMVSELMDGEIDPLINLARAQGRDAVLMDARWGDRNTVQNWVNSAWPFLSDFRQSLTRDIAMRTTDQYKITGANQCLRGLNEFSMNWATSDEEAKVQSILQKIGRYANKIDDTLNDWPTSRWRDFNFAYYYSEFSAQFPRIPKFRVRTDVTAESSKTPPRTGVYVSSDDPNAALQFAWNGGGGGKLRPASTFNQIGLDALQQVGRRDLWFDEGKMLAFVQSQKYAPLFANEIVIDGKPAPSLASPAVARSAFTAAPSHWYFVEIINDEFEDIAVVSEDDSRTINTPERLRVEGGHACARAGYWFTPAKAGSRRYFKDGEIMPVFGTDYGVTFWQWDENQQ
ncbi:hypothetical protein ACEN88_01965 [Massilia sp. CT11-108]|uniref:hypothetical protein n=1 Tax=Massilia sp. CT11-108 TaxID=3393900 RepID=UPI0039A591CD